MYICTSYKQYTARILWCYLSILLFNVCRDSVLWLHTVHVVYTTLQLSTLHKWLKLVVEVAFVMTQVTLCYLFVFKFHGFHGYTPVAMQKFSNPPGMCRQSTGGRGGWGQSGLFAICHHRPSCSPPPPTLEAISYFKAARHYCCMPLQVEVDYVIPFAIPSSVSPSAATAPATTSCHCHARTPPCCCYH